MKPSRIILVRHGESEGNIDKTIYEHKPDYRLNLTSDGHQQALECGEELSAIITGYAAAYTSPFERTKQTLDGIQKGFKRITHVYEDPRIREQEWGHLRSADHNQIIDDERNEYGPFFYRFPDGESCADVYDRVTTFIDTLHRDFEKVHYPNTSLVITHGMLIRVFLMRWLHWDYKYFETLKNPKNCAIIMLEKQDNGKYILVTDLETKD